MMTKRTVEFSYMPPWCGELRITFAATTPFVLPLKTTRRRPLSNESLSRGRRRIPSRGKTNGAVAESTLLSAGVARVIRRQSSTEMASSGTGTWRLLNIRVVSTLLGGCHAVVEAADKGSYDVAASNEERGKMFPRSFDHNSCEQ